MIFIAIAIIITIAIIIYCINSTFLSTQNIGSSIYFNIQAPAG